MKPARGRTHRIRAHKFSEIRAEICTVIPECAYTHARTDTHRALFLLIKIILVKCEHSSRTGNQPQAHHQSKWKTQLSNKLRKKSLSNVHLKLSPVTVTAQPATNSARLLQQKAACTLGAKHKPTSPYFTLFCLYLWFHVFSGWCSWHLFLISAM